LIKRLDEKAEGAVLATIELGESELLKLHGQLKKDPSALTEESTLDLRKSLIAIQLVRASGTSEIFDVLLCPLSSTNPCIFLIL